MSATGKLDKDTIKMSAKLGIPHHEGAGGVEDFVDKEAFQKHVKRVSNRLKKETLRALRYYEAHYDMEQNQN